MEFVKVAGFVVSGVWCQPIEDRGQMAEVRGQRSVHGLNVEHRTSRFERAIKDGSMLFLYKRIAQILKEKSAMTGNALKRPDTIFDVGRSTFDVRCSSVSFQMDHPLTPET